MKNVRNTIGFKFQTETEEPEVNTDIQNINTTGLTDAHNEVRERIKMCDVGLVELERKTQEMIEEKNWLLALDKQLSSKRK